MTPPLETRPEDIVQRLLAFADIEDSGGSCDLQFRTSPSREAATEITTLRQRIEALEAALGQIAGKNDLSMVADADVEAAARGALYECELIARQALGEG